MKTVSECDDETVKDFHMIPAHSVDEAMEKAVCLCGRDKY